MHVFRVGEWQCPIFSLPVNLQDIEYETSIAARACPVLFEATDQEMVEGLGHSLVWAVSTFEGIIVYSTNSKSPILAAFNYH